MVAPKELIDALARSGNPFACLQTNPSLVLDAQTSWGRTETIEEGARHELVRTQLPVMAYVTFVVRAIEFENGTNPTQLYPYACIKYGNGSVQSEAVLDVTGGWIETVVGSSFQLEVFLADEQMFPPEVGSGASAKIQGWACVGVTPYPQRNTQFQTSMHTGPTAVVTGCDGQPIQGRIADIDGFVLGAGTTPSYLVFWDSNLPAIAEDFGTPPILLVIPIDAAGLVTFEKVYANSRPFINGVSYALSASPTSYAPATATTISVTVETLRDS